MAVYGEKKLMSLTPHASLIVLEPPSPMVHHTKIVDH